MRRCLRPCSLFLENFCFSNYPNSGGNSFQRGMEFTKSSSIIMSLDCCNDSDRLSNNFTTKKKKKKEKKRNHPVSVLKSPVPKLSENCNRRNLWVHTYGSDGLVFPWKNDVTRFRNDISNWFIGKANISLACSKNNGRFICGINNTCKNITSSPFISLYNGNTKSTKFPLCI